MAPCVSPCAQEFCFLTDRQSLTIVVARSVLGVIAEDRPLVSDLLPPQEHVVFVLDASGSMQVGVGIERRWRQAYLEDVKSAVNLALVQQFGSSES